MIKFTLRRILCYDYLPYECWQRLKEKNKRKKFKIYMMNDICQKDRVLQKMKEV